MLNFVKDVVFGNCSVKIVNSTENEAWVRVEAERQYLVEVETSLAVKLEKVEISGGRKEKYDTVKQEAGYSRLPSGEYSFFDVPQGSSECFVSAFDSKGKVFGTAKCFRATNNSYFNVVLCSDYAMRKGFKNRTFRCCEGTQEYWGPFCCPGCRSQKCRNAKSSGSDGWCGYIGEGKPHPFTRLDGKH